MLADLRIERRTPQEEVFKVSRNSSKGPVYLKPKEKFRRIDSSVATQSVTPQFEKLLEKYGAADYDLNLKEIDYISGSGLRSLVVLQKGVQEIEKRNKQGYGRKITIHPSDRVFEVLMLAGLDTIFNIPDEDLKRLDHI